MSSVSNVTREELLARAKAMIPTLRARAEKAERDRRMPDETHRDFLDAGFYKIYRAKRFGGFEMPIRVMVEVCAEIGRGCGSSAWVLSNIAGHEKSFGMRDPAVQAELRARDPEALTCAAFPGKDAKMRRVDGGIVVDGIWNFASGVDQASWCDLNVFLPREGSYPEHFFALVPKSDYEVIDDWFVTGLAATGSRSVRLSDCFVPERLMMPSENYKGGPTPGSAINPGPLFKAPIWATGGKMFSGPLLGIARGALDLTLENLGGRRAVTGADLAQQQSVHLRVAEAEAELDAAAALIFADADVAMEYAKRGEAAPTQERVRWRRNDAFAAKLCLSAVERLHALAGARRLAANDPFQRHWRDAHAAAAQISLAWDLQATNSGRAMFGLPPVDPRI
jgi:3-hydroxy-9,10-secoandrosta-1,3,5(10)-triene-9,17-dione monooxygenase